MFYKRAVCCIMAPKVYYFKKKKKSASLTWKRTGMNVENRSMVFAKCVEIVGVECGEQECSVLVSGLLTELE